MSRSEHEQEIRSLTFLLKGCTLFTAAASLAGIFMVANMGNGHFMDMHAGISKTPSAEGIDPALVKRDPAIVNRIHNNKIERATQGEGSVRFLCAFIPLIGAAGIGFMHSELKRTLRDGPG